MDRTLKEIALDLLEKWKELELERNENMKNVWLRDKVEYENYIKKKVQAIKQEIEATLSCKCESTEDIMRSQRASKILLSLDGAALIAFETVGAEIGVRYENCDIKDGDMLVCEFGTGDDFEAACADYLGKIRGKTLVFNAMSKSRTEIKVLG